MPTRADTLPIYVMAIYHIDVSLLLAGPLCHVYDGHSNYLLAYTYVVPCKRHGRTLRHGDKTKTQQSAHKLKTNLQLINSFNLKVVWENVDVSNRRIPNSNESERRARFEKRMRFENRTRH